MTAAERKALAKAETCATEAALSLRAVIRGDQTGDRVLARNALVAARQNAIWLMGYLDDLQPATHRSPAIEQEPRP